MPTAIDATPGSATANAYCTLSEAATYNDNHISGASWAAATADAQTRAILTATRLIDEHYDFSGMRTSWVQVLEWPRFGVVWTADGAVYSDGLIYPHGPLIPSDVIPQKLKDATAELARTLLASDRTADNDAETQGIASIKAGEVEVTFRGDVRARVMPDAVSHMLSRFGVRRAGRSGRTLIRT